MARKILEDATEFFYIFFLGTFFVDPDGFECVITAYSRFLYPKSQVYVTSRRLKVLKAYRLFLTYMSISKNVFMRFPKVRYKKLPEKSLE